MLVGKDGNTKICRYKVCKRKGYYVKKKKRQQTLMSEALTVE